MTHESHHRHIERESMKFKALLTVILLAWHSIATAQEVATRYGKFTTDVESLLMFKGKVVKPEIQGNNYLSFPEVFKIGDSDVVLVQDHGGTACPALFHLVTITPAGIKQSPKFGSCSDIVEYKRTGSKISVSMPDMRLGRGKVQYVFKDGVLKENGKVIK